MLDLEAILDRLDLGALEEIEAATGKTIGDLFPDGKPSAAGLIALVWIDRRATDPSFSIDDARKIKFTDLTDDGPDQG